MHSPALRGTVDSSSPRIAIVGLACVFPDARTPVELWENVLAQRRAFRRLPPERLRAEDFFSADTSTPDRTYSTEAAVIEGYEFDRVAFRVVGSTFRSADLTHWLALDVAGKALADAGFAEGRGLPREATGVLLGNTLTGEFARANLMRLRWPYVRRVLEAALDREGWLAENRRAFIERLEAEYKSPFPAVGEESLAGGLSNTIAGRICNHFDLKGGGYTVDGACASSLLAVANACALLTTSDLDVALAGGVDLSLDPFELVGFAKTGALAVDEMRVFDRRSAGFWPGEGCGFVTLMREQDALAQGCRIYALIRGWGISSDGSGGITRPEAEGQVEALRRAYHRAGFGIDTVAYCEGHGTGTAVGDATELEVLSRARREANPEAPPAVIGSIKANIGHTKAAAGIAGLIKATMAVHTQVLPPTTGCEQPHAEFSGPSPALRVLAETEAWPQGRPLRASVSAMGFGGINAHLVIESTVATRRTTVSPRELSLSRSQQDAELFLLRAETVDALSRQVEKLLSLAGRISRAELADLAAHLQKTLEATERRSSSRRESGATRATPAPKVRAAIIASRPVELGERLRTLQSWLSNGQPSRFRIGDGVSLGSGRAQPRIAFLFPGQGAPTHLDGGIWRRRFESIHDLYARAALPSDGDPISTRVMQPAVVTASLAGLTVLNQLGLRANAAIGHSLGEITALRWAGVLDDDALLDLARIRGAAMADLGSPTGAMLALAAPWPKVQAMLKAEPLAIVGYNSPHQTVVAGDAEAIHRLARRAQAADCQATLLPVSHAFHTPLVSGAVPVLAAALARKNFALPKRPVLSTVTGEGLEADEDLRALLCRQVTSPVRFEKALGALLGLEVDTDFFKRAPARPTAAVDLLIEVGPGEILTGLVRDIAEVPVIALDAGGPSLKGLLQVVGAAFALGAKVQPAVLFADRFTRAFDLDWKPKFFVNPCELAPVLEKSTEASPAAEDRKPVSRYVGEPVSGGEGECRPPTYSLTHSPTFPSAAPDRLLTSSATGDGARPIELIRKLVAQRTELPVASVKDDSRMLSDLHLNSITVGQLVSEAARQLRLPRVMGLTEFANASVAEMALALEELQRSGATARTDDQKRPPPGVDIWFKNFVVELVEMKRPAQARAAGRQGRRGAGEKGGNGGEEQGDTLPFSPFPLRSFSPPLPFPAGSAGWKVFATDHHPLADELQKGLATIAGGGVALCLPENPDEEHISLMLNAARAVQEMVEDTLKRGLQQGEPLFVVVQYGWGGAGFARTLHLETPRLTTCVVNVPPHCPRAADWILAEAVSAHGYIEAHYDVDGRRREPRLKWLPLDSEPPARQEPRPTGNGENESRTSTNGEGDFPIGPGDVLLVTGGGKGIAAECALALGRETGASVALLCRSLPESDKELAENLKRFDAAGVRYFHVRADVTNAATVRAAVAEVEVKLGPVTALMHAAGTNTPQLINALDESAFRRTVAPKIQGARNVLAALVGDRLRLFITFGSIIARSGLRGEGDYATANEWLTAFTEEFQAHHPRCRCLALEWSVWSGVGMGERLGRIESLIQQGIMPIPVDEGVRILLETLKQPATVVAQVVTGRFGETPTLKLDEPELPLRRFLERKRVYYPGVELVVEAALSATADPYLNDHVVQKQKLLPAVLGLEAMAQAAMALTGASEPPNFEDVQLTRPVTVPDGREATIRLVALRRGPDLVEVCLRSEETDFQVDYFRARCRFGRSSDSHVRANAPARAAASIFGETDTRGLSGPRSETLPLDPLKDLYGRILFHEGRFRRLRGYQLLKARECVAEIAPAEDAGWFGMYLPQELALGDPAARDAALHAIQACIPHRRILPTGIQRLTIHRRAHSGRRWVRAKERFREGDDFTYDLEVTDADGGVIETWEGLRLRAVETLAAPETWPEALLGPYLERRLEEMVAGLPVKVALRRTGSARSKELTDAVIQDALGNTDRVWRRPDGKPLSVGETAVSASHANDLTLAVAGRDGVAVDLEAVVARSESAWRDLLGEERHKLVERISRERQESADVAATRLWTVAECLKKAGLPAEAPLVLASATADGWVLLRSGVLTIASGIVVVDQNALAVTVALQSRDGGARQTALTAAVA